MLLESQIIQIIEHQRLFNEPLMNVYYFRCEDVVDVVTEEDAANELRLEYWTGGRQAVTMNQLIYEHVTCRNLSDEIGFADVPVETYGSISTGDTLPPYCTVTIKLVRSNLVTRNGYKRFAGIPEASQNNGQLVTAALTAWGAVASDLTTPITISVAGGSCNLVPVIIGTAENGEKDITKVNPIQSASVNRFLGTQNSRKIKIT